MDWLPFVDFYHEIIDQKYEGSKEVRMRWE